VEKVEAVLQMRMLRVTAIVEEVLKRDLGVSWFKPSLEDQLRLLVLTGWEEKFKISIAWMLKQLVPFWRGRFARYQKGSGLGFRIATLVGKKSEQMLQQRIAEQFPDREHLTRWRTKEQARQWSLAWDREPKVENWEHPHEVILQYQRGMNRERRERKSWVRRRKRRRYRNNPWISFQGV